MLLPLSLVWESCHLIEKAGTAVEITISALKRKGLAHWLSPGAEFLHGRHFPRLRQLPPLKQARLPTTFCIKASPPPCPASHSGMSPRPKWFQAHDASFSTSHPFLSLDTLVRIKVRPPTSIFFFFFFLHHSTSLVHFTKLLHSLPCLPASKHSPS